VICVHDKSASIQWFSLLHLGGDEEAGGTHELELGLFNLCGGEDPVEVVDGEGEHFILPLLLFTHPFGEETRSLDFLLEMGCDLLFSSLRVINIFFIIFRSISKTNNTFLDGNE